MAFLTMEVSLPWRFRGVTRVHGRSRATYFFLQIDVIPKRRMRREASHVSFLMCPFCVRALVPSEATNVQTGADQRRSRLPNRS
jgi:hypothetical protein